MRGLIGKFRGWSPVHTGDQSTQWIGLAAGVLMLALCVTADVVLTDESAAIVGAYVAAPFVTALIAGPGVTAIVAALALLAAALSPEWNMGLGDTELAVRMGLIAIGGGVAIAGARLRSRSVGRSERLRLLDSVGAVADGSLPLAETLRRVTEVIVPGLSDICMVDAVHEGQVSRLATRARGRDDADEVEQRFRIRPPALPQWLVRRERSWRHIPEWWPRVRDEELRRMARSDEDLEFLRGLGVCSTIVVPIRARDRNLGALTLIAAWSRRRYGADDVRFAQILASRIGLALDNAGLFSDLESIERRMDTVMAILDEAIIIHGADGELVFANPAAAEMLGFETSEDAVATPAAAIRGRFVIRDEQGNEVPEEDLASQRVRAGESPISQTLRATDRETGQERWTRSKAQAIVGPAGEVLYSVTAIEDITDVKRAEFANRLLARTGELVTHSDDYRATLELVPRMLVPEFSDWCSIEIAAEKGPLDRVAMVHHDQSRVATIRELRERYPLHVEDEASRIGDVLRTGVPELIEVTDEWLAEIAVDADHLQLLREIGMGSVLAVPMTAGGPILGALVFVNDRGSRRFDEHDVAIAEEVARRTGLAIESARLADERAKVADALQRELLPPSLPRMPGWEVATMYEPAGEVNEVGGDFYEVFKVDGGWAVVLGDVSGKGAAAAALTAEARHTIRTAGILSSDPAEGLRILDGNLRGRDDVALCSVAMLVLPDAQSSPASVRVYLAGHPHPMLVRDGHASQVGEPGPLLGVVEDPEWVPVEVKLERGDQLVLYTDGVIEARREGGERFGSDRLRAGLDGCRAPDLAVERVRGALSAFGAESRQDDAAVVAIRRTGPEAALGRRFAGEPVRVSQA